MTSKVLPEEEETSFPSIKWLPESSLANSKGLVTIFNLEAVKLL